MFIRFVVGSDDEHHRLLTGVITEARLLRDRNALQDHEVDWLEETYAWLNAHLPCPPIFIERLASRRSHLVQG